MLSQPQLKIPRKTGLKIATARDSPHEMCEIWSCGNTVYNNQIIYNKKDALG